MDSESAIVGRSMGISTLFDARVRIDAPTCHSIEAVFVIVCAPAGDIATGRIAINVAIIALRRLMLLRMSGCAPGIAARCQLSSKICRTVFLPDDGQEHREQTHAQKSPDCGRAVHQLIVAWK